MHLLLLKQRHLSLNLIILWLLALVSCVPSSVSNMDETAVSYIVQASDMRSAKTAVFQLGAPITHELGIINAVAADLTPAQYRWLNRQTHLELHENAKVESAALLGTVADHFKTQSFANSTGSFSLWTTDWLEGGESNGPTSGDVYISASGYLQIKDDNRSLEREVDLSSATTATLTISYKRSGLDNSNDYVTLDISSDGGATWTELTRFAGPRADSSYIKANYDISAHLAANTRLRFATSPSLGNYDKLYLQDVTISLNDATPATPHVTYTVRDEFNAVSYSNNDGTTSWESGWWDPDEGQDGPAAGLIQVTPNGYLQVAGAKNAIIRTAILKDAVSATLSFRYQRQFVGSNDSVRITFRPTPAAALYTPIVVTGANTDTTWQQATVDLTSYLDNPGRATLMLEPSYSFHSNSSLKVDDVEISFTTYAPNVDYPTLVDADAVHNQGIAGANVTVAVLDTGMGYEGNVFFDTDDWFYNNSGMRVPVIYDAIQNTTTTDFFAKLNSTDASGHGTHVSSIIASSQNNNENGRKNGIAPKVDTIPVKAFNSNGNATYADVIRGVDWIVANKDIYGIRVINASFFSEARSYYWEDPLNQALMQAWQAGIVVVASAGNIPAANNNAMTIGAPGNIPYIITVGGMTDSYTPDDTSDDAILSFSALGPTAARFVKPDIVAPGGHIRSYMPENSSLVTQHAHLFDKGDYFTMSGTSQAAAVVSGVVALMLDNDPSLAPDTVKCRLMASARLGVDSNGDLAAPIYAQGAGLVDAYGAVNSTASGCANQGLDIAADLAGTQHFAGRVQWDDQSQEFVIYDANGSLLDHVSWSGGGAFMSGGGAFMSGGGAFMSGGGAFMSGGGAFMSGGGAFMSGGGAFMSGTTPWNASVVWDNSENFVGAASAINTWIDQQE